MEWKAIETAPRDGTLVLLSWRDKWERPLIVAGFYEAGQADQCWYSVFDKEIEPVLWTEVVEP